MIILSVSMPKSGSAWYFNLTNDLLVATGQADIRDLREKYRLDFLEGPTCRLTNLKPTTLARLLRLHFQGHTFVVKTHRPLDRRGRFLLATGVAKASYIYRDPRDVLVSALDHGRRLRAEGQIHSFARLVTFEDGLTFVEDHLAVGQSWIAQPGVFVTRYEDVLADTPAELGRLAHYLGVAAAEQTFEKIAAAYRRPDEDSISAEKGQLHFNKGIAGRYRQVLTSAEIATCNQRFAAYLPRLGYPA